MKIVSHPKKIQRYYKVGLYTSLGSLVLLFAAVGLTLAGQGKTDLTTFSFVAMILGLVLSQIGVFFANRFGKSPRIDERISQGLKGLDDRYVLYHYTSPVPHLLTGPSGVWVLVPQYQAGTITFENNRYKQRGVRLFSRVVGQEGITRPDMEAQGFCQDMEKFIKKTDAPDQMPAIQSLILFTNPKAVVQVQDSPIPTMHVEKLKDFIRRKAKEQPAEMVKIRAMQDLLPQEDIS
ncbi:MAG: hypothetical protein IH586_05250 [Anaerolineaceae bacterium]|nr:hypothetical protein [Anaerolineaceae bacterium]